MAYALFEYRGYSKTDRISWQDNLKKDSKETVFKKRCGQPTNQKTAN